MTDDDYAKVCQGAATAAAKSLIPLAGKRFGRLEVIEGWGRNGYSRVFHWLCVCLCGNLHVVRGKDLRRGHTKSCGCLNREMFQQRARAMQLLKEKKRIEAIYGAPIPKPKRLKADPLEYMFKMVKPQKLPA